MTLPFLIVCSPDDDPMIPDTETPSSEPERPDDGGEDNEGDNNNGDEATSRNISIIAGSSMKAIINTTIKKMSTMPC